MLLLVGLGNPGPRYERNRHNIGFMALDRIAEECRAGPFRARFEGLLAEAGSGEDRLLFLKPMTYMNDAGRSVGPAMRFYKLAPERVVVFHDEIDLAAGKVRVKTGGGAAGHNGIRSVDQHIGPNYRRVRLGVGHPGEKERVHGHVLGDFSKADQGWLAPLLDALARAAPLLVAGDDAAFASRVAELTRREGAPKISAAKASAPETESPPTGVAAKPTAAGALAAALGRAFGRLRRPPSPS